MCRMGYSGSWKPLFCSRGTRWRLQTVKFCNLKRVKCQENSYLVSCSNTFCWYWCIPAPVSGFRLGITRGHRTYIVLRRDDMDNIAHCFHRGLISGISGEAVSPFFRFPHLRGLELALAHFFPLYLILVMCVLRISAEGGSGYVPRRASIGGVYHRAAQDVHGPSSTCGSAGGNARSNRVPGGIWSHHEVFQVSFPDLKATGFGPFLLRRIPQTNVTRKIRVFWLAMCFLISSRGAILES